MDLRPRLLRRAIFSAATVGLLTIGAAACQPATTARTAYARPASDTQHVIALINNYRAANGVAPLAEAGDADAKAQQQAANMASSGNIYHSNLQSGIQPGWSAIGENVGVGSGLDAIESAFQASAPHRANLLSGAYNQVGVGVAVGSDGRLYVAQEFVGR